MESFSVSGEPEEIIIDVTKSNDTQNNKVRFGTGRVVEVISQNGEVELGFREDEPEQTS